MTANGPQNPTPASTFDRRAALRAAAWSTPVIAFAAAAPPARRRSPTSSLDSMAGFSSASSRCRSACAALGVGVGDAASRFAGRYR